MIPTAFITRACEILGDTTSGLSGTKIVEHLVSYAYDYDVNIPYAQYPFPQGTPNKRTALRKNLMVFSPEQQIQILNDLCQLPQFTDNNEVNNLRYQLISKYGHLLVTPPGKSIDTVLIEQTRHWLGDFPDSLKLYEMALTKFENKIFLRNLLDDIRLCLEKLTQSILNNSKSLENQINSLGQFLKDNGCSKELSNMFRILIDYYTKYQNTYVKHDDAVIESEIEIMFEMTCSFMRFLIRINGNNR
ncbi:hypothetical protein [Desulfobacter sp.]|uniref:hypothetical protein n=1 Tax=Desulfobacter sp. TaxID=2294 RepID=UPI00257BE5F1|nr:hypothetical protein [Desulfobacter sp.]